MTATPDPANVYGTGLKPHLPELLAKDTPNYLVEYGIRYDDGAMVFHFFPPKHRTSWDPSWSLARRLELAMPLCFDTAKLSAGFVEELNSFYVIVGGLGTVPDPWITVERFFRAIDGAQ
jgi:hypothetical protein